MEYLGVDVAKESLEMTDASGSRGKSLANTAAGIEALLRWLARSSPIGDVHLIVEPTSTYHHPLVHALAAQGLAYTLVNPARTAAYARVQGKRAKTDRVTPGCWPPWVKASSPSLRRLRRKTKRGSRR